MPNPTSITITAPATTVGVDLPVPKMSGYIFGGWYKGKAGTGEQFTPTTSFAKDIIVYAYWYKYKVTFDSGTTTIDRGATPPATTVDTLPAPPVKTDYTFAGWWTAPNGGGTEFTASSIVNASNAPLTVYAKWEPNATVVYTVTYNSNGGTAAGPQYVVSPAINVGTLPTDPTRLFYSFNGWFTAASGGDPFKAGTGGTDVTKIADSKTQALTVYAQWTATPGKTVTFNSEGGTAVEPQYVIPAPGTVGAGNWPADPAKPCYTFGGWKDVHGAVFDAGTTVTDDITVYAQWTYVGFTSSYPAPSTYTIGGPGPSCIGKVFYITDGGSHGLEAAPPDWYLSVDPLSTGDPSSVWIDGGYEVIEEETCKGETGETCISINNDRCNDGTCILKDSIVDHVLNRTVIDYHKTQITTNGNTKTAIGTGPANTDFIIAQSADAQAASIDMPLLPLEKYAAKLCRDYRGGGLDKWFLPSKDELAQLYTQRDVTRWGGFADSSWYWSSSEYNLNVAAWSQNFTTGAQAGTNKSGSRFVRPVRAF
jgi:uncharacterized repeat protein (TIGR02543 family)